MAPPIKHGPNIVATSEQVEKLNHALKNLSDDQIKMCEQLLLEGGNSLTALVVGESGTGKSTFINTFLGKEVAKVDSGPTEVTRKVKFYTGRVGSVDATVVEVPELDTDGIREHRIELQRYCPNGVDVVFVCQKMYDRHRPSAIETLRRLSIPFSRKIHKKAVFVMTFANDIPRSWQHKTDKKILQEKLEKDWCDQADAIRTGLVKELKMSHEEVDQILVLPAGYHDEDDPESQQILGVTSDWINDIRLAAANASQTASPAILKVIASPLNTNSSSDGCDSSDGSEDSSGGSEDSSGGSEDSSGGSEDSSGGPKDSSGGPEDSSGGSKDSSGGPKDSSGGPEDSSGGPKDSSGGPEDSSGGSKDSSGGPEDSSGGSEDSSGGPEDSSGGPEDSSGGPKDSSGGSKDSSGGFFGLMSKYIHRFALSLKDVCMTVYDKICNLVKRVVSTLFNAVKGIADAVQKAFTTIYKSGALTGAIAGAALGGAVAAAVLAGTTGIVIGLGVIITLNVVLVGLFGVLQGFFIFMGAASGGIVGSIVGAGIGAIVGGILGSIAPGPGTVAGAGTGAEAGAWIGGLFGGGAGAVFGGAAVAKAVTGNK